MIFRKNLKTRSSLLENYSWSIALAWSIVIGCFLWIGIYHIQQGKLEMVKNDAYANFNKDQALRLWATMHGGVYVPVTEETFPNPYLRHIDFRDITRPDGKALTLMNPAYMLRQVMDKYEGLYGIRGHITSLKPFRPETSPDDWEKMALQEFERGAEEISEVVEMDGKPYYRYMAPMITTDGCLKCHGHQGYKAGDIRGGVSVSVPMAPYLANQQHQTILYAKSLGLLWLIGFLGLVWASRGVKNRVRERDSAEAELQEAHDKLEKRVKERTAELEDANEKLKKEVGVRRRAEEDLKRAVSELQSALDNINTLSGLLPICAKCKKIRDDKGYWNQIEVYIKSHSDASFSHGLCPECMDKIYGDEEWYKKGGREK